MYIHVISKQLLCIRLKCSIQFLPLVENPAMFWMLIAVLAVLSACVGSGELDTAVDDSGCLPWTYRPNLISFEPSISLHASVPPLLLWNRTL